MIHFFNQDCNYLPTNRLKLRRWIQEVVRREGYTAGDINYVFCSSEYHRQMNRDFLGHDYYTDVITFEDRESRVEEGIVAGEVYIDVATVEDNADLYNALPINEMRRVIVHGALHLCGHLDKSPTAARTMRRLENRYLKLLNNEMLL
jgi:rRNA maturation RNase YbeY